MFFLHYALEFSNPYVSWWNPTPWINSCRFLRWLKTPFVTKWLHNIPIVITSAAPHIGFECMTILTLLHQIHSFIFQFHPHYVNNGEYTNIDTISSCTWMLHLFKLWSCRQFIIHLWCYRAMGFVHMLALIHVFQWQQTNTFASILSCFKRSVLSVFECPAVLFIDIWFSTVIYLNIYLHV